jgi:hypothetical protein
MPKPSTSGGFWYQNGVKRYLANIVRDRRELRAAWDITSAYALPGLPQSRLLVDSRCDHLQISRYIPIFFNSSLLQSIIPAVLRPRKQGYCVSSRKADLCYMHVESSIKSSANKRRRRQTNSVSRFSLLVQKSFRSNNFSLFFTKPHISTAIFLLFRFSQAILHRLHAVGVTRQLSEVWGLGRCWCELV